MMELRIVKITSRKIQQNHMAKIPETSTSMVLSLILFVAIGAGLGGYFIGKKRDASKLSSSDSNFLDFTDLNDDSL